MEISKPVRQPDHSDYQLDLEEAIDLAVREGIDEALLAGHKPETVFNAAEQFARTAAEDPAYPQELSSILLSGFRRIQDEAARAGWSAQAFAPALLSVVQHQRIAYAEDPDPAFG